MGLDSNNSSSSARQQPSGDDQQVILNHSICILSDNYHLSFEVETEMKVKCLWSRACSRATTSGGFTAPPPFFFGHGREEKWTGEITGMRANTHTQEGRNMNRTRGAGGLWETKRKGSFHAGGSFDSLVSRGYEGPIRLGGCTPPVHRAADGRGGAGGIAPFVGINLHLRWLVDLQDPHRGDIVFHYL